jgi:hypothetical protein
MVDFFAKALHYSWSEGAALLLWNKWQMHTQGWKSRLVTSRAA